MDLQTHTSAIGILAYGSLVNYPGEELEQHIIERISCQTPFNVEYARLSKSRSNAPTLIPVQEGAPVNAVILILDNKTSPENAASMLWRRERNQVGSSDPYIRPEKITKNSVTIEQLSDFHGITTVLYTKIPSNMGIMNTPPLLAELAIKSALDNAGNEGRDGLRYLKDNINSGIITQLTPDYRDQVLQQLGVASLEEAIARTDAARPGYLNSKADWAAFEVQVREITDLIHEYGINTTIGTDFETGEMMMKAMEANRGEFIKNVHKGFKMGQDRILSLILEIQDKREANKAAQKIAKPKKDKSALQRIDADMKELEMKENILRHLMDSIVWQMIHGQTYISRRLYNGIEGEKKLRETNFQSVKAVADEINKNKADFALITDLTGYVQVGDLLCIINGQLSIQEVKDGIRNHKIIEILGEVTKDGISIQDAKTKYQLSEHDLVQMNRQLKQIEVMKNVADVINYDKGIDNHTGRPISIITPGEPTPRYTERLFRLREELDKNNMLAYDVIDKCVHIGLFKGEFRHQGLRLLKALANLQTDKFLVIDMRSVLVSIYKPLFTLPFDKEFMFDIIFGRVFMYFLIDLEAYIGLADEFGLAARWATKKEMGRVKILTKKGDVFEFQHRGIILAIQAPEVVLNADKEIWLADGVFMKMTFEQIHPRYTMYSTWYDLEMRAAGEENEKRLKAMSDETVRDPENETAKPSSAVSEGGTTPIAEG